MAERQQIHAPTRPHKPEALHFQHEIDEALIHGLPVNAAATTTTATTTTVSMEFTGDVHEEIRALPKPPKPEALGCGVSDPDGVAPFPRLHDLPVNVAAASTTTTTNSIEQLPIEEQAAITTTTSSSEIRRLPVGLNRPAAREGGHGTRRKPRRRSRPLPHHQPPPQPRAIRLPARRRLQFARWRGSPRRGRLRGRARHAAIRAPGPVPEYPTAHRRLQVATHCKALRAKGEGARPRPVPLRLQGEGHRPRRHLRSCLPPRLRLRRACNGESAPSPLLPEQMLAFLSSTSMPHIGCSSKCVQEITRLTPSIQKLPTSGQFKVLVLHVCSDLYMNQLALKKLNAILLPMVGVYTASKLSKLYAGVGLLSDVNELSDEMAEQDCIPWNVMMDNCINAELLFGVQHQSMGVNILKPMQLTLAVNSSLMDIAGIHFAKPLLEEDMSGSDKGVFTALVITCYKIICVTDIAEKYENIKVAMELKNAGIEDGHTAEVPSCRYALLVDVKDKLYFDVPQKVIMSHMAESMQQPQDIVKHVFPTDKEVLVLVVVKSQILVGDSGLETFKARQIEGGVHIVKTEEATETACKILGTYLVTKQIGLEGKVVCNVYLWEKLSLTRGMYVAITVDRKPAGLLIFACSNGGTSIEYLTEKYLDCIEVGDVYGAVEIFQHMRAPGCRPNILTLACFHSVCTTHAEVLIGVQHHSPAANCGNEPEVAHVILLFSEEVFSQLEPLSKKLCSETTDAQYRAEMRLLAANQLVNQTVDDALSGLLLVEAILQYKGWLFQYGSLVQWDPGILKYSSHGHLEGEGNDECWSADGGEELAVIFPQSFTMTLPTRYQPMCRSCSILHSQAGSELCSASRGTSLLS